MNKIQKTKWHSLCTGKLAKGCSQCVQGRKLVLFITGECAQRCFYCPISEQKFGKDIVYANEWKIQDPNNPVELFEEANITQASGAGITGGDPLMNIERCCQYIRLLKQKYGKEFHIHLYTPLKLITIEKLQKLYDAGLDEIRVHPNLDNNALWDRLALLSKFQWHKGIEIPALPGYQEKTKKLLDFAAGKIDFINFNELELSDTSIPHYALHKMNFKPKDSLSYGVKGSKEMALEMLEYCKQKGINAHFCTAKLKDAIQVKNRLQIRAKNICGDFEKNTGEGTIIRYCLYLPELSPGFSYREKLKAADKQKTLAKLQQKKAELITALKLSEDEIKLDQLKFRLILNVNNKYPLSIIKKLNLKAAKVEEYPTADSMEVEIEFL